MTQPNDLPPLPESISSYEAVCLAGGAHQLYSADHMTAYGLQCAEAAVERERAKFKERIFSMVEALKVDEPGSSASHRAYATTLVEYLASCIK